MLYAVLAAVSDCYPPLKGRLLTRYSPVRHSVISLPPRKASKKCFVRLECVKHAASVHPEPGSNSLKFCISSTEVSSCRRYLFQSAILASYFLKYFVFKVFNEILIRSFCCCSISKDQRLPLPKRPDYSIISSPSLSTPFLTFYSFFSDFLEFIQEVP